MDRPHQDNVPLAVLVIIFTVFALSLGDALIKLMSGAFVLSQIFVLRSILLVPVLVLVLRWRAPGALSWPPALGWTVLRSLLLVSMWVVYYAALPRLDLSVLAAVFYTSPLFITLFAAVFTGDRVRPLGWVAVALGFAGVLLILRPSAGDFNAFALLPLLAAVLYALAMILTRTKCRAVHPVMLSLALNIAFVVAGVLGAGLMAGLAPEARQGFLFGTWAPMGAAEWISMVILALAILIGSLGAAFAYQKGRPAIIGTFDFAYVGFAVVWGILFFAEYPDLPTAAGMGLIVLAGILSLR